MVSLKMGWARKASPIQKRSENLPIMLLLTLIIISLLFGALIGLGAGVLVLALLFAIAGLGILLVTGAFGALRYRGEGVFWAIFGVVLGATCLDLISPIRTRGVTTVLLMVLGYLAWRGMLYFMAESKLGKIMPVFFGIFFICGVIGAIHPHSHWRAVIYQIGYNLKLPIMLSLGFAASFSEKSERRFWFAMQCLLVYALLMAAFQLVTPGLYSAVARGASSPNASNPFIHALPFVTGPFVHPGVLAFTASFGLCLFLIRQLAGIGRRWGNYVCMGGFLILLILAGERQEAFDAIIVCAILLYMSRTTYSLPRLMFGVLICISLGGALLFALGSDKLIELLVQWGILPSPSALVTPRAILYNDAIYLAKWQFPFGTGFGTFGGDASRIFDRSIYEMLGYEHRYWWYRQSLYLLDTYWPNLVAEAGFIGGGLIFLFALCMAWYAMREAWTAAEPRAKMLWRIAFAGQLLALGDSFTSPVYGDPNAVALPFIFFGIAFVYSRKLAAAKVE